MEDNKILFVEVHMEDRAFHGGRSTPKIWQPRNQPPINTWKDFKDVVYKRFLPIRVQGCFVGEVATTLKNLGRVHPTVYLTSSIECPRSR